MPRYRLDCLLSARRVANGRPEGVAEVRNAEVIEEVGTNSCSVIDDTTQYFIAESSKSVDLVDTSKHAPGDDIWLGCHSVAKAGRICMK